MPKANTLTDMKKRDNKEKELFTYELRIKGAEMEKQECQAEFNTRLAAYQEWKKQVGIEGIKY